MEIPAIRYCSNHEKNAYMDWKIQDIYHFKRPLDYIPNVQFNAKSSYQRNYTPIDLAAKAKKVPKV